MEEAVGGLDIGTSSIKFILYGKKGVCYSASKQHVRGRAGSVELDPQKLMRDIATVIRKAAKENKTLHIAAIGISSFFPSLILVDEDGKPLTPILTWMDHRGSDQVSAFKRDAKAVRRLHERTGCIAHESHTLWKILWMRKNRKGLFKRTDKFLSLPEFLTYQLTKEYAVSFAIASTTGLFNIKKRCWDKSVLSMAGITAQQLSACFDLDYSLAVCEDVKKRLALSGDVSLVLGAGDGHLSNVGSGCVRPSVMCSSFGTSAALRMIGGDMIKDPAVWTYALDQKSNIQGVATNAGASTLSWFYQRLLKRSFSRLSNDIKLLDLEKQTDLIFLPFVDGERGPGYNAKMKPLFIGRTSVHQRDDLLRAVLEGVFFNLYQCYQALTNKGKEPRHLVATGGYVRFDKLLQMQADIFNHPVIVPDVGEASATGAALAAFKGINRISKFKFIKNNGLKTYTPDKKRHKAYMEVYQRYLTAYQLMARKMEGKNGSAN